MNKHIIIGNLTKDVELRSTTSGTSVASFTVATTRRRTNADGEKVADFHRVIVWGQLADICGRYLSKGKKVGVVGELQHRSYEGKDGEKKFIVETVADQVEFLTPKGAAEADPPSEQPAPQTTAQASQFEQQSGWGDVSDDDLPF